MRTRYQVIPRTLIFIFQSEKVLLIKGAPGKKNFANLYNGLGGHAEHGETILECARRELLEESGIQIKVLSLCGIVTDITDESTGIQIHLFKGTAEDEDIALRPSAEGHPEWIAKEDLSGLPLAADVPFYLDRIWDWQAGDPLIYATVSWQPESSPRLRFTT